MPDSSQTLHSKPVPCAGLLLGEPGPLPCSCSIQGFVLEVGSDPLAARIYCYTVSYMLLKLNCSNEIQYLLEIVSHICKKCDYYIVVFFLCVLLKEWSNKFSLCAMHQS